jgi:hypothetical protein
VEPVGPAAHEVAPLVKATTAAGAARESTRAATESFMVEGEGVLMNKHVLFERSKEAPKRRFE